MFHYQLRIVKVLIVSQGSNYSAGEKQLLALCRALVKNSAIIVLVSYLFRHIDLVW
jgi:ABC-type transport system involved in cytochrome bd biosynthesis fused ATPase/permease subunit